MTNIVRNILLLSILVILVGCGMKKTKILVFNKANGFVHESIEAGTEAVLKMTDQYPFIVDVSDDSLRFRDSILEDYDVIVFMNTSGVIFDQEGRQAFQNYIRSGGGFVGVHGASTNEYEWEWFGRMLGNHFDDHPKIQKAIMTIEIPDAPSTEHLPSKWEWTDEWYNWRYEFDPAIEVLISVDESTYEGGKHSEYHPISWRHEFEGGRVWYTAIGHQIDSYKDENFIRHIAGGIKWVSQQ